MVELWNRLPRKHWKRPWAASSDLKMMFCWKQVAGWLNQISKVHLDRLLTAWIIQWFYNYDFTKEDVWQLRARRNQVSWMQISLSQMYCQNTIYLNLVHYSWPNEHEKALNTQFCRKPWSFERWNLWKARKIRLVKKTDNKYLKKKIKIKIFLKKK